MPKKVRIAYFLLFALIFIVAIPTLLLYATGYSLDDAFNLTRRGGVYVYVPEIGAQIFIGDDLRATTSRFEREALIKNLEAKNYLLLVSHENFWPWAKFVDVKKGEVAARFPLLVPKVMQFDEVLKNSTDYIAASKLFATSTPASKRGGDIRVFASGLSVRAEWLEATSTAPYYFCEERAVCQKNINIWTANSQIDTIDFFPGREDAILISFDNAIYALELDTSTYHNIYPIFRGQDPDFRISGGVVYVKDGAYIATTEL